MKVKTRSSSLLSFNKKAGPAAELIDSGSYRETQVSQVHHGKLISWKRGANQDKIDRTIVARRPHCGYSGRRICIRDYVY